MKKHEHSLMPHVPHPKMKAHRSHPTRDKAEGMRPKSSISNGKCASCGMMHSGDCKY